MQVNQISDIWTNNNRMPEGFNETVKDMVTLIAGRRAYSIIKKGETGVQTAVSWAKSTIIIRSTVVAVGNVMSDAAHLALRGVPLTTMASEGRKKTIEIQTYVKNMEKIGQLEIDYAAKVQDKPEAKRIEARIRALQDANAKLSINDLIENGEFGTIVEGLTEADVQMREGNWADYIESKAQKLPGWGTAAVKNALITKDTELFVALNRMVSYSSFVAKAVLYDHLRKQGMEKQEALDTIMEEFVQYNRSAGRGRDYLESMGLMWFQTPVLCYI